MKTLAHQRKGFTLVEVLVAETVFLVLLIVVMQLVFGTTKITQHQKQQIDAMTEARQALDRMKLDWTSRVRRGDVVAVFEKRSGNDEFRLLSQVFSYDNSDNSEARKSLAAVSYRINDGAVSTKPEQVLLRGALGYIWQSNTPDDPKLLKFPFSMPKFDTDTAINNYEVMGQNVFRMEICFLRKVSTTAESPYTVELNDVRESNPVVPYTGDNIDALNLTSDRLLGVVVCVAVIGEQGKKILGDDPSALAELAEQLEDVTAADMNNRIDPLAKWTEAIEQPDFASGVPRPVVASIRVYQRVFYVSE
ncbi:MAG: prepilin-type N-terminal cleavage/methylation domain-containing protein [Verrucomicrobiales bacterium]|jgi:type II secretory pathway pseudopilin PulG|nr:prepilin-type N-terminal cleavage/methylation domain-containing protein [Verrucomicrobiales bacterium]